MSTEEKNKITAKGDKTCKNPKKAAEEKRLTSISKYEKEKKTKGKNTGGERMGN